MQGTTLQDMEVDMGSMREEIRRLDWVDEVDRVIVTQKVAYLQHKIESTLQNRHVAHQLLQRMLNLVKTRMTG